MLIPLRIYNQFSLLDSVIDSKSTIKYCKDSGLHSVGFANENNLFGTLKWCQDLIKSNIKPIVGSSLKISKGNIWVYCMNNEGYKELSNLISHSYVDRKGVLNIEDVCLKNCLILVDHSLTFEEIKQLSENNLVHIAISRQIRDEKYENTLFDIANKLDLPCVAAPKFYYAKQDDQINADALWCIKNSTHLKEENRNIVNRDEYFQKQSDYTSMFKDIKFTVKNSEIFAKKCNYFLKSINPIMPAVNYDNPIQEFRNKLEKRLVEYCSEKNKNIKEYRERLEFEIDVILQMNFQEYFLIVADIVSWCKKNDIPVGPGRGSAASSLTVYFLGITNLDPIEHKLMFERFLNPSRVSLPDIDLDFCQEKRHFVIEYIQNQYGKEKVALIMAFGSLQYRSAVRDTGRILQLPYSMVDRLCKQLPQPFQGVNPTLKDLRKNKLLDPILNDENKELFEIAENIEGIPRHVSTHAAGVVIGNQKLSNILPLFKEEGLDIPVVQGSLKEVEALGLVKFDILGLTILSVLNKTCKLLLRKNIKLDLDTIDLDKKEVFEMLSKGYVKAVFQVDSPGFKRLMIDMRPNVLNDIIAAGALYRPGPMADIPQFVKCKHDNSKIEYLFPELENILKETYGVIVYQEQILQIAKELAGYSLKDADLLRRAMGKKIKSEIEVHEKKFIEGVDAKCNNKIKAKILYDTLVRFASYAFPKAHAAPYGIITYTSAYCKKFHAIEFICATLFYENSLEKVEEVIQESRSLGVKFLAPCINKSKANFDIIDDQIIFGTSRIKGIGDIANKIVEEREKNGNYKSLYDFAKRIKPNIRVIENLIYAGAFDCMDKNRAQVFSEIEANEQNTLSLFEEEVVKWKPLELILHEYKTMNCIFSTNVLSINLSKFNIHNKIEDITESGDLYCLGMKNNSYKTKDGREVNEYIIHDANGIQIIYSHHIEFEEEFIILEIEKNKHNKNYIKKAKSLNEYLDKYRKIFVKDINLNEVKLSPGNTSLFIDDDYKKDIQLTFNFLLKNYDKIQFIA